MIEKKSATRRALIASTVAAMAFAVVGAHADDKGKIKPRTVKLDQKMSMPMATGCSYEATINGTVKSRGSAQLFDPNLDVVTEVRCPDSAAVKATENVASIGPLSHVDLEERLERRATVANPAGGCLYAPDFKLVVDQDKIEMPAVRFLCERK